MNKISVIVPVYNVEKYISKCVESIINQTYRNLEIILINDGSTDKSGDICEYFSKKDDRIILVHQNNQGLSMARNNGLDIASGDYISFIDSDDWIETDMFELLYNNCLNYNADISMCNFRYVDEQNQIVLDYESKFTINENNAVVEAVMEGESKIIFYLNYNTYSVVAWNKLYKINLFTDIRFPRGKVFEDVFVTHKLIDKANKVVVSPDYKYYYLSRNESITKKPFTLNRLDSIEGCIERYNYIASKYPFLENICRKHIFLALLSCVEKAIQSNVIDKYRNELNAMIQEVSNYSMDNCGISHYQKTMLELLFGGIRKYILGRKYFSRLKLDEQITAQDNDKDDDIENNEDFKYFFAYDQKTATPAVSVIVPVYNTAPYLNQCIDSILSQTLKNIEIICINDGSTDGSLEILNLYQQKDERIKVISRANKGVSVSRNEALQIAKGEYVIFMDSDDFYASKSVLMHLFGNAKQNKALICGGSLSFYVNGVVTYAPDAKFNQTGLIDYADYQNSQWFTAFIFNREMLLSNNIFFPDYTQYEDPPFLVRAMVCANNFYAIASDIYRYRIKHKVNNFNNLKIADVLRGLTDCLKISSENNLSKLHNFTANSLYNDYYPFSTHLLSDKGELHKLLFKFLTQINYDIVERNFISTALDFFAQRNSKYFSYKQKEDTDFFSVFEAYKKILIDKNIYSILKDDFVLLASREYKRGFF